MLFRAPLLQRSKDEGEKPFWISYADLMTAMMMLFLVVMAVSIIAITNPGPENSHAGEVKKLCIEIKREAEKIEGVTVDCDNQRRVDFGPQALFQNNEYALSAETKRKLREFVPIIHSVVNKDTSRHLLKEVIVEGYASQTGSYLHNLQLSMRRAESVLCTLFETPQTDEKPLSDDEKTMIRDLFLVGGYSFNNGEGKSDVQMRRVEFKLEFLGYGEKPLGAGHAITPDFGKCQEFGIQL